MAHIYEIRNLINGKTYIGSTNNYKHRVYRHLYDLRHNRHANYHLQRAWNKYGECNFKFNILEEVDDSRQFEIEQLYLDALKLPNINSYNIRCDVFNVIKKDIQSFPKECVLCERIFEAKYEQQLYCSRHRNKKLRLEAKNLDGDYNFMAEEIIRNTEGYFYHDDDKYYNLY